MKKYHLGFRTTSLLLLLISCFTPRVVNGEPAPPRGSSVLLVTDVDDVRISYSKLLTHLESLGRAVTFAHASSASRITLRDDGAYKYDGIVMILTGRAALDSTLPIAALEAFVDSGGAFLLATGAARSSYADRAAELLGVDTDEKGNVLVDHFRTISMSQTTNESHDSGSKWVGVGAVCASESVFGDALASKVEANQAVIAFRGAGASLFRDNELVAPLMWGSPAAIGRKPSVSKEKPALRKAPRVVGSGAVLAAGVTTWSGGRAAWFGSAEAMSDAGYKVGEGADGSTQHAEAIERLVGWTLSERGVLRVKRVSHELAAADEDQLSASDSTKKNGGEEQESPSEYRVKDVIEFTIEVQEWDGKRGEWIGFKTDDMQVEFVMLNPWVRTRLQHAAGGNKRGVYTARIQVPDQIGVYKFKVEYVRAGLTPIRMEKVVPVRPFLHNEYERFIAMASPYYLASFSMMGGVFVLAAILLFGNVEDEEQWTTGKEEKKD